MDLFTDEPKWTGGCAPFIHSILYHQPGVVCFDGYFYREPDTLPIERVLTTPEGEFHIEIIRMVVDHSEPSDSDDLDIPIARVELHYRVIATLNPTEAAVARKHCIALLAAEERRNRWHKQQREWEEWQFAVQLNHNLTFTPGPVEPPPPLAPSSPFQKALIL